MCGVGEGGVSQWEWGGGRGRKGGREGKWLGLHERRGERVRRGRGGMCLWMWLCIPECASMPV